MIRYKLTDKAYQSSFGIVLLLDPFSELAVRSIWATLAHEGITASLPAIVCALPHITLSICRDLDQEQTRFGLQQFAAGLPAFQISFSALGAFPTQNGTAVFLQPTITEDLLCAHRRLHTALEEVQQEVSPHYLPGRWTPHCSLGIGLPEPVAKLALSSCLSLRLPLLGQVQAVALLEMLTHQRQVIAGCERARFRLGDGAPLPPTVCPKPAECPFIK